MASMSPHHIDRSHHSHPQPGMSSLAESLLLIGGLLAGAAILGYTFFIWTRW